MKLQKTTLNQAQDIEWHLRDPRTRKWIVQCVVCQRIGYKADAPDKFFGRAHLVKYFEPLALDEGGVCASCREALKSSK